MQVVEIYIPNILHPEISGHCGYQLTQHGLNTLHADILHFARLGEILYDTKHLLCIFWHGIV